MSGLRELYQEVILDHNRNPRNFRRIEPASHRAQGHNPLCGDRVEVFLLVEDGVVKDIAFEGDGCAISTASASLMTEQLKGKSVAQAQALFDRFHDLLTTEAEPTEDLGKLGVLAGVREFPTRVKCATLPWHTLQAALRQQAEVSTE
jgi:SUF system FeS assembly protein, NifU family